MWVLALLASTALGQEAARANWDNHHSAQLVEAGDGDLQAAAKAYETLVREKLASDDPILGQVLFSLGRARYLMGDIDRAREALNEGIRTNTCHDPCNDLLSQLELEQNAIKVLPVRWNFDSPDHGFFHPWVFDKNKGSIRIDGDDNPALLWETTVDPREGDMLVVGFDHPKPVPTVIRLKMQSEYMAAQVEIVVIDEAGNEYIPSGGRYPVPSKMVMKIELSLDDLVPVDPTSPPFEPARINRFEIRDVSASAGAPQGQNFLYIDDFEVR